MVRRVRNKFVGQSLNDFIAEERKRDPVFAAEFDRLRLARQVKELREAKHVTQAQLATKVGTKQPAIARLERGEVLPTLELVARVAAALGRRLELRFVEAT